ncbi:hypothetical protein BCR33DRAFT_676347 [Rhizoclosmatium globosum]|uniref:Elongation of fatty acids protein n=1 Tax=Rhizoclosmatium globosum TaxID=329046 RepID=A0A1Y2CV09_9FUNG|nr:hypothetical protein BCR33DRAFT_676347 [Rhizoclosmatium globosum]|eukprot:ORY50852.1 hypothetical protein BCR33DRAFT_676347 [Rhizoclosmatium globosum]
MDVNTILETITDKTFLLSVLQTSPEDAFIQACNQTGQVLQPLVGEWADRLTAYIPASITSLKSPVHTDSLPFMNPIHVLMTIAVYFAILLVGTTVMRAMPKLEVKLLAFCHNVFLTSLSAYMCWSLTSEAFRNQYQVLGNRVDPTENGWKMAKLVWLFYISKVTEFMDTFIMVLKKNNHQISFLHVYHHSSVLLVWWFVIFVGPGGEAWFSAALNSFIHVVMYGYYLLSSLGFKQVSFIKKYITMMQMTQFCLMMVQALGVGFLFPFYAQLEGLDPTPVYPVICGKILLVYMVSMLSLFLNFYIQDRKRDKARRAALKGIGAEKAVTGEKTAAKKAKAL